MSSVQQIRALPTLASLNGEEVLIIDQQVGAQATTYIIHLEALLGYKILPPEITQAVWDTTKATLTLTGVILPNALIEVNMLPVLIKDYTATRNQEGQLTCTVTIELLEGLMSGEHEIKVSHAIKSQTTLLSVPEEDV